MNNGNDVAAFAGAGVGPFVTAGRLVAMAPLAPPFKNSQRMVAVTEIIGVFPGVASVAWG
jgi:hypothetical protein